MMKGTVIREIRFKDGHRILKGDSILIAWPDPRLNPTRVEVFHKDRVLNCLAVSALGWICKSCTEKDLAEAVHDSVCATPNGSTVEPDGVDSDGVPSWLMIHGLM
jgi:hypothetical protein